MGLGSRGSQRPARVRGVLDRVVLGVARGWPHTAKPTEHTASRDPAIIMANGDPIVAWAEAGQAGVFEISAARWDGEAWVVLGDGLNEDSAADALDPSLAFRGTGRFFVFEGRGP